MKSAPSVIQYTTCFQMHLVMHSLSDAGHLEDSQQLSIEYLYSLLPLEPEYT